MTLQALAEWDSGNWQTAARAARASIETRLFIDGRYVDAAKGGRFATVDPATGETVAEMSAGTAEDIDLAVAAAKRAFRSGAWSRMAPRQRMEILFRFASLIERDAAQLAVLETMDMGKPIADVVGVDLPSVIDTLRFMAECIDKIEGTVTNTEAGVMHMVLREPIGVVGAISPWNYPLLMAVWKIAPALAAGNTVVLKPAEQAPMSCLRLAELFAEAGGPPGVLNVVNGIGEIAGKALALHGDVAKITFTGSTEVGKLIMQYAGQSNLKEVALECGGKSPQVFVAISRTSIAQSLPHTAASFPIWARSVTPVHDCSWIGRSTIASYSASSSSAATPTGPAIRSTRPQYGPAGDSRSAAARAGLIEAGQREGARLEFGGGAPKGLERAHTSPLPCSPTCAMT